MFEENDGYSERYDLSMIREDGEGGRTSVEMTFSTENLPDVLAKFRDFLQSVGFTYVNEVITVSDNGIEHSSDD